MVWVKLFKPTWGRIAVFIVLFAIIALLDQTFLFFPESPLTYNVFSTGTAQFLIYLLIIPYLASCVIPAFFIREFRHAKIHEFVKRQNKKPTIEGTVDAVEDYDKVQDDYASSLKKPLQKAKEKPKTRKKTRTRRRK